MNECVYAKKKADGHGTNWKTACGHWVYCEAPEEVGFSFAPLPNKDGKFCHFCGKEIVLKELRHV